MTEGVGEEVAVAVAVTAAVFLAGEFLEGEEEEEEEEIEVSSLERSSARTRDVVPTALMLFRGSLRARSSSFTKEDKYIK